MTNPLVEVADHRAVVELDRRDRPGVDAAGAGLVFDLADELQVVRQVDGRTGEAEGPEVPAHPRAAPQTERAVRPRCVR
ncbi:MAG: hypothetical protein ABFS41_14845 [Myxococcota bacterium]